MTFHLILKVCNCIFIVTLHPHDIEDYNSNKNESEEEAQGVVDEEEADHRFLPRDKAEGMST